MSIDIVYCPSFPDDSTSNEWIPVPAHSTDAGADVRIYLPTSDYPSSSDLSSIHSFLFSNPCTTTYLDGKIIYPNDLVSSLSNSRFLTLFPNQSSLVPTGFRVALFCNRPSFNPVMLLVPRSGFGTKGLCIRNTIGVIDQGYRGDVKLSLINSSPYIHILTHGCKVAQALIFECFDHSSVSVVDNIDDFLSTYSSHRNTNGFGSTGSVLTI